MGPSIRYGPSKVEVHHALKADVEEVAGVLSGLIQAEAPEAHLSLYEVRLLEDCIRTAARIQSQVRDRKQPGLQTEHVATE